MEAMTLCICITCFIASAITTCIAIKTNFDVIQDNSRDMREKHKLPDVVYDESGNKYVRMDTKIGTFCYEKIDL